MPSIKGVALVTIPLVAALAAYIAPIVTILGIFRDIQPVNNGKCVAIKGELRPQDLSKAELTRFNLQACRLARMLGWIILLESLTC